MSSAIAAESTRGSTWEPATAVAGWRCGMATSDLPDAPWIVESWYTGNDPDYEETPYERSGRDDFLEGADSDYGWRILAWALDQDADAVDDGEWQSVWEKLKETARRNYCLAFETQHHDDAAEMYNEYWRRWRS